MAKVCCGRTQPWSCLDPSKGEAPGKKSLSEPGFQVIDAGIHFWNHSLDMCFRMLCGDSVEKVETKMAGIFTTFQLQLRSSRNEAEPFELFFADALHASGSLDDCSIGLLSSYSCSPVPIHLFQ